MRIELFKEKEIKSLDGLRALACFAVIIAHLSDKHTPVQDVFWREYLEVGKEGVALFFSLSGFIITLLLLREKQKYGEINIVKFISRRIIKIIPVLYVFLIFLCILMAFGVINISYESMLSSFLFYKNYSLSLYSVYNGHVWSLAVEEHFYLIWPFIVSYFNKRSLNIICVLLIIISPIMRVYTYYYHPELRRLLDIMTHNRIDSFMFGCLAAINYELITGWVKEKINTKTSLVGSILLAIMFLVLPVFKDHSFRGYWILLGIPLNAILSTIIIVTIQNNDNGQVYRILNSKIIRHIGIISYSIYIWQEFCTYYFENIVVAITLSYILGLLSYILIENPMEIIKKKYVSR